MNIQLVKDFSKDYDLYVMPQFEGEVSVYQGLSAEEKLVLEKLIEKQEFTGKQGTLLSCPLIHKGRVVEIKYVGLGKRSDMKPYATIEALYKGCNGVDGDVLIDGQELDVNHIVEAIYYGAYDFNTYKSDKKEDKPKSFNILVDPESTVCLDHGKVLAEAVVQTRNLVNEPANVIYPETLAAQAVALGKTYNFEVEVFEEDKIEALKMDAFLSVARESAKRPRFIVMRYKGDPDNPQVIDGLVGKGLTYDSGGLSLKPSPSMVNMKTDMSGAATVIGTMCALARLGVKRNVVAVIAACENSIGGNAYRPGDIISSMSGKTIEIGNTDAEGRLTLADAVYYVIHEEKAVEVVDVATLTGAVCVALGHTTTGVLTNRNEMYAQLERASEQAGERVWQLPSFSEYKKLNESKIADIKNAGGSGAGTISAGLFIEAFAGDTPWMHLDIAGTADANPAYGYYTLGGTGQMVRTLFYYYMNK